MSTMRFAYNTEELRPLIDRLDSEHYTVLYALCDRALKQANRLNDLEGDTASEYVMQCTRLIGEIQHHIKFRKERVVSYISELLQKESESHDCQFCTGKGSCSMQHGLTLAELRDSNGRIKSMLHRLQMAALPLYSESIYPDAYRVLRNQMALIENSLTELHFLEETYLIPKITDAQKKINATDD